MTAKMVSNMTALCQMMKIKTRHESMIFRIELPTTLRWKIRCSRYCSTTVCVARQGMWRQDSSWKNWA